MTTHLEPTDRERAALRAYTADPLDAGDAVLLLDGTVCLELTGIADAWEAEERRTLADLVSTSSSRALLAIVRGRGELLPRDHQLWRELGEDLQGTSVALLPVQALPAA